MHSDSSFINEDLLENKFVFLSARKEPYYYECNNLRMVGGYNILNYSETGTGKTEITISYQNLPPHYSLNVRFVLFLIDGWNNEIFKFYIDSIEKYQYTHNYLDGI